MNEELLLIPPIIGISKSTPKGAPQLLTVGHKRYIVPEDAHVTLNTVGTHRNPKYWPTTCSPGAFEASSLCMIYVILMLIWQFLSPPVYQNGFFKQILHSRSAIFWLSCHASLSFAPGLYEVIHAATSPAFEWFKNLPSDAVQQWAVYALTMEKIGHTPLLYIGSGTSAERGVIVRWAQYNNIRYNKSDMPKFVLQAFENGFKITHKGLIVSAPLPLQKMCPGFAYCLLQWRPLSHPCSGQ